MAKANKIAGFDCSADGASGIRLVLEARMEEMRALRVDALDWTDPEGVHSMRVASRRLRSALRDFTPYLRKRQIAPVRNRLKKVAGALGAVRDQDVAILALEKLAAGAPPEIATGIEWFADDRRARREGARAQLLQVLAEDALANLQKEFIDALQRATRSRDQGELVEGRRRAACDGSLLEMGREIIIERFEDLRSLSVSLYQPLNPEPLHRMRIAAKRLRYALELFTPCWGKPIAYFAEEVAKQQASLGELHDCDVWVEHLGARLSVQKGDSILTDHPAIPPEQRGAATWLLSHFTKSRTRHFRDALARWHKWETGDFAGRLASLVTGSTATEPATIAPPAEDAVASELKAHGASSLGAPE